MVKILRNCIVLFVFAVVCCCNRAICAAGWRPLAARDTADAAAAVLGLAAPGAGLWPGARDNGGGETLQHHYNARHGQRGIHTRTLPSFNGRPVAAIAGATVKEVVMARFHAALIPPTAPGAPPQPLVFPHGTQARTIRIPVAAGQVQVQAGRGAPRNTGSCSIILPAVPPGGAPVPANVCTVHFT